MAHWIILKQNNNTHFLNLERAYQIVHERPDNPALEAYVVYFPGERLTIRHDVNPATFGHISAYLGILEEK
jgi:hypothetical protein